MKKNIRISFCQRTEGKDVFFSLRSNCKTPEGTNILSIKEEYKPVSVSDGTKRNQIKNFIKEIIESGEDESQKIELIFKDVSGYKFTAFYKKDSSPRKISRIINKVSYEPLSQGQIDFVLKIMDEIDKEI